VKKTCALCLALYCGSVIWGAREPLQAGTCTLLEEGKAYLIQTTGNYEVTTAGRAINATITTTADATLELNHCHLNTQTLPLEIGSNTTLHLHLKGPNRITATATNKSLPAIYVNGGAKVIFAEAVASPGPNTLFLRGCLNAALYPEATPPPLLASTRTSIVFQSGVITLAAVEDPTSARIPSLISAHSLSLSGATLISQICPYASLSNPSVSPLFDCSSFSLSSGQILTAGDAPFSTSLSSKSAPYDTTYAYNSLHFESLSSAASPVLSGGLIRSPSRATFYGLPPNTSFPAACFTNASNSLSSPQMSDASGCLSFSGVVTCNQLQFNYASPSTQSTAMALDLPLLPSDQGMTLPPYHFGISQLSLVSDTLTFSLALHLPEDNASLSKTLFIQLLLNQHSVLFDGAVTFSRPDTSSPFTTTLSCPAPTSLGSHAYSIRAYR
jgi:hypothetical protein